jgi:hypothetical protein
VQEVSDTAKVPVALNTSVSVVIVTYRSAYAIKACIDSLHTTVGATLRIAVYDNASPGDSGGGPGVYYAIVSIAAWTRLIRLLGISLFPLSFSLRER